jgi:hypothetical protein
VRKAGERDLLKPGTGTMGLTLTDGVTSPLAGPALRSGTCTSWNALQLTDGTGTRLLTDLGELVPAHLTFGPPGSAGEVSGAEALRSWAPYACSLGAMRAAGVRSVNAWVYARQPLPDTSEARWGYPRPKGGGGSAAWACTRAETWRGGGARVLAQFHTPGGRYGAVAAKAENVPACGERDPHVLAGVLWRSEAGNWYLLAAGSRDTASISASGGVRASSQGHLLAVQAQQGAQAELKGILEGGQSISGLR